MGAFEIRSATPDDAGQLLEIYSHYVTNTAVSFEYEVPSLKEFKSRIEGILKKYPYLCVVEDGKILGYAYANTFKERKAYQKCVELSIYLSKGCQRRGYGRALYEALESRLKKIGILNAYACIATTEIEDEYLTNNSVHFHSHLGFKKCGEFKKCGIKFGRWYDMVWMEKMLGEHINEENAFYL